MNKKAFTLIELLAVIVIVGVLATLLVPVLGKTRKNARIFQCMNNLRQIGIAWFLYLDEHNEQFPPSGTPQSGGMHICTWGGAKASIDPLCYTPYHPKYRVLNPYVGVDVSKPANEVEKDPGLKIFQCPDDTRKKANIVCNYTFGMYGNSYRINMDVAGLNLFQIEFSHSKYPLVWENCCFHDREKFEDPHKINVLFLDGHVKMHDCDFPISSDDFILE